MSSWHYQIIKLNKSKHTTYALAEVYLNDKGQPFGYALEEDIYEDPKEITETLEDKLSDIKNYPVLEQDELELNIENLKPEDDPLAYAIDLLKKYKNTDDDESSAWD